MKKILWDKRKSERLLKEQDRKVTFERCVVAIESGHILNNIENPARNGQNIFILEIDDYAYVVPYVEDDNAMYFKTIYPSRKYAKLYLRQV